jgi:putative pyoverdin transport system ATP-binding/permease protein
MRIIIFMLRSARKLFLLSVVFSIFGGIATTGLLISINNALEGGRAKSSIFLAEFILLAALAMAARTAAGLFLAHLGQDALFTLRMNLSRQILGTPLRKLEETGASKILAILTDDVLNITNFLSNVPILCTNTAIAITCLGYMAYLSLTLLGVVFVFLVVGTLTYQLLTNSANRSLTLARQNHNALLGHFRSLLGGMKELKLHRARREDFFSDVLQGTAGSYRSHMLRALKIYTAAMSWGELLMFFAIGLVIFFSFVLKGVSGPTVIAFVIAMLYLIGPLETIMNSLPQIGRANVALKTVEETQLTLLGQHGAEEDENILPVGPDVDSLKLSEITFGYGSEEEGGRFVLGPLNLSVFPGEILFITGGNGSGKSTLAKILAGLYLPETGHILLNGREVTEESLDAFRQNVSAIFPDFHLFESLLGLDHPELDEEARRYLVQLQLNYKVQIKNGNLSTIDLSHGQRKRLALLTAYLEDRPVYIFDEWAADQDPFFREMFYFQILPELRNRGKAVVVISHDDRYFHVGDQLIKMEYGQIIADQHSFINKPH